MPIPYVPIRWRGRRAFVTCPACNLEIELRERKDHESYALREYQQHLEAHHPELIEKW